GFFAGVWGLSLPFVFLIGLSFYTILVAKKWKRLNASSVAELFTLRYNPFLGKVASLFLLTAMLGFSANYIKSMQILFQPIFQDIHPYFLSLILITIILLITLKGGLVSIIQTDLISFFGTMIFIPLLFIFSFKSANTNFSGSIFSIPLEDGEKILPTKFILSLIILTMFTYIAAPWYGQKIFAAKSEKIAFRSVGIASILVFLLYGFPVLAVYYLKIGGTQLQNSETGVAFIVNKLFSPGFKGFGYFILFCAGATTLGGVWSAMTTMVVTDISNSQIDDNRGTKRSIYITIFIVILSYIVSITFIDKVLDKLILANIPIAALSFGLIAGFYWKKASSVGVIASLVFGLFWGIFCYTYFGEKGNYTWYWAAYGIPGIFIFGIIFSLLFPQKGRELENLKSFENRMN
ncbi:MAG: hypothetical protein KDK36_04800, partial [Leptospiraceae bacterium]|nr:hypothetical protein [Leptospiraceae bacterium]